MLSLLRNGIAGQLGQIVIHQREHTNIGNRGRKDLCVTGVEAYVNGSSSSLRIGLLFIVTLISTEDV